MKINTRKVLFAGKLALVVILGYTIVRAVSLPVSALKENSPAPAAAKAHSKKAKDQNQTYLTAEDYAQIVEKNPFDGSTKFIAWVHNDQDPDLKLYDSSVSEELGLALVGTISGNPAIARAIIKNITTNQSQLYKKGQVVSGCLIESINPDSVLLIYNGSKVRLQLNSIGSTQNQKSSNSLKRSLPAKHKAEQPKTQIACVETILEQAIIKPHTVDGKIEGLRVTGIEKIEGADVLGLKNGDVIRSVNGHQLFSKQQAYQVMKKAKTKDVMNIELSRNNRTKEVSFSLR
jgi:general secretion pathway protein C